MPYTNIGQLIEPYLRPLGKQTIAQIPQIQAHQLAKERLGANKEVWAEQIIESQQNREIARQAQDRLNQLSGISSEKLQPFIGEGMDPDTAMKLMMADKAKLSSLGPTKPPAPSWQKVKVMNEQGQVVEKIIDANKQAPGQEYPVPTKKVKVFGQWKDLPIDAANYIEAQNMENVRADQKRTEDKKEKDKQTEIKYLTDEIEKASRRGDQQWLFVCEQRLADIVDVPTTGKTRDPKIDEARSILMEARQELARYEKISASQDPADMGAQLAPTTMPRIPPEQFLPLPPKAAERITWGEPYINKQGALEQKSSTGQIKSLDKDPNNLKDISTWFKWHLGQYNSAKRGVGQFIEDPNKDQIAQDELGRAATIAKKYVEKGGNPEDLGLVTREVNNQLFIQIGPEDWMRIK